jgi:hypothetical protein
VAGVLFVLADLVIVVPALPGQGAAGGLLFRSVVALAAVVLLLLGLVGLYAPQSETMGFLGLIAFLATFVGLVLQRDFIWASLLANAGWALFGAASLRARVYPRGASMMLIIGAVLSVVVDAFLASSLLPDLQAYIVMVTDVIFDVATVWLGLSLFLRRDEEVQHPHDT